MVGMPYPLQMCLTHDHVPWELEDTSQGHCKTSEYLLANEPSDNMAAVITLQKAPVLHRLSPSLLNLCVNSVSLKV